MKTETNQLYAEWIKAPSKENYDRLGEALYIYISRIVKREFGSWFRVLRDDAISESAMEVFRDIAKFDPAKGDFEQWVYGITCHTCVDVLRQRRRKREWGLLNDEAVAPYTDPAAVFTVNQMRTKLSDQENALVDQKLKGASDEQAASELGIEVRTLQQRWLRLKEKLRTL